MDTDDSWMEEGDIDSEMMGACLERLEDEAKLHRVDPETATASLKIKGRRTCGNKAHKVDIQNTTPSSKATGRRSAT